MAVNPMMALLWLNVAEKLYDVVGKWRDRLNTKKRLKDAETLQKRLRELDEPPPNEDGPSVNDHMGHDKWPTFRAVLIFLTMLPLAGCEEYLNLSNEKDDDTTAQEVAEIMTRNRGSGIYIGGDLADSKADTIGAPIIVEGSVSNSLLNTAQGPS